MFEIKETFYLNGSPIKIVSGALHYFRIVPEYWEDRLSKLKAMGCNTVETYVPWNMHEPKEGQYNFEDMYDIKKYIETAQSLGLYVIVRPAPYICAEWEFGGLPAWLLKDRNMKFRTYYQPFIEKVDRYYQHLLKEIDDLQITKSGPIIMMQIENEYGSYGNDKKYLKALADMMIKYGVDVPLVTSDGTWMDMLENGTLPEVALPTANFGSGSKEHFGKLKAFHDKESPLMVMEFWNGWFTAWGDDEYKHTAYEEQVDEIDAILSVGHINFYMIHGGTNFGFTNGSNYYDELTPDITSYDYDAPITEWGDVTEKYKAFRSVIEKHVDYNIPTIPVTVEKKAYGQLSIHSRTSLFDNLSNLADVVSDMSTLSMEDLDQNFGYVLYQNDLGKKRKIEEFELVKANDRAKVYINRQHELTQYDRELGQKVSFELTDDENELSLLVENMGRVNYGKNMIHQQKGIVDGVLVNGAFRNGWKHFGLPLDNIDKVDYSYDYVEGEPSFSQFELVVEESKDTFIDMTGWGKGVVFINGFNLGRFWEVGPQFKLYLPGPLLKTGKNEIVIFETEGTVKDTIELTDQPPY
ncbi:glycoside hydrolase family 35 protein [Marinilactibacillus kalidii]|uniref:glycoside hydrolase family 35 protein n=1 Tax=Marinilactibacillus kalidii TaxID=2820274 RepID=UPI001FC96394|nr:beta-galactosidase family protein [Marinilactibacillus kalidii]